MEAHSPRALVEVCLWALRSKALPQRSAKFVNDVLLMCGEILMGSFITWDFKVLFSAPCWLSVCGCCVMP
jgi:hypothetical protein